MNNGCCSNCQAKAMKKKKNSKIIIEEFEEDDVKQKQEIAENEKPKTDSTEGKGSDETSDLKDNKMKKKKNILTWQHSSTKKEKDGGNPPRYGANSMVHHGGPNLPYRWPLATAPRGYHPPFSAPMYGSYGGCGGPIPPYLMAPMYGQPYGGHGGPMQPYQYMPQTTMFNGAHISPYPPMAGVAPFPYWQTRPYMDTNPMDTNPMKRYTSYADNYSYCYI